MHGVDRSTVSGAIREVGTFRAYASPKGWALLGRALYIPASSTEDRDRRQAAGIGDEIAFATKCDHFRWMLQRATQRRVGDETLAWPDAHGRDAGRPHTTREGIRLLEELAGRKQGIDSMVVATSTCTSLSITSIIRRVGIPQTKHSGS